MSAWFALTNFKPLDYGLEFLRGEAKTQCNQTCSILLVHTVVLNRLPFAIGFNIF